MTLLLDVGNTHTHVGLANDRKVLRSFDLPTAGWRDGSTEKLLLERLGARRPTRAALATVVPAVRPASSRSVPDPVGITSRLTLAVRSVLVDDTGRKDDRR